MEQPMKKLVISLERRPDRRKHFSKNNEKIIGDFEWVDAVDGKELNHQELLSSGGDTNKAFRCKFKNRKMTHGEVGCAISHIKAWEIVAKQNEPMMIFEDDAVILDNYDEEYYESLTKEYNLIYINRIENNPDKVTSIDDKIEIPSYPYNLTAYILTPSAAKILINTNFSTSIIPADEYVPLMLGHLKPCALKEDSVSQAARDILATDIEPVDESDWFIDFKVHPITVGTDRRKNINMMTSANLKGIYPKNLGNNVYWEGTDMTQEGGGHKVNLVKEYIQNLPDTDVVLFTDAYDVLYNENIETITRRYLGFKKKVLFAAEDTCWPDETLSSKFENWPRNNEEYYTKYQYLNSGVFIAEVGELKSMLSDSTISNSQDDQLFFQRLFLSGDYDIGLDYEGYLFQCHEPEISFNDVNDGGQLYNPVTNCCPCIYHGNGGAASAGKLKELTSTIHLSSPMLYIPHYGGVDKISDDMFLIDFMTQYQCEDMIDLADRNGQWGSLSYDKFPAQEIRLKELDLWDSMERHWENHVNPIIEKFYPPMEMYGMRDAFVMRYSMDTQRKLNLHTDASLVTGSVKLNEDYVGADLIFPRQNISNKDVPVGKAIIFPGQVTHGHACTELTSGVKYSLTMWSSRYHGDLV